MRRLGITIVGVMSVAVLLTACGSQSSQSKKDIESVELSSNTAKHSSSNKGFTKKQSSSSSSTAGSSSESTEDTSGPDGSTLYNVPSSLQGTWYTVNTDGDIATVTFGQNTLDYSSDGSTGSTLKLYKTPAGFDPTTASTQNDIASAKYYTVDGTNYLNIMGWNQSAGDGSSYAIKNENGNEVMVEAGGAEFWIDAVYYKTQDLAQQYKDTKYDDLNYY